MRQPGITADPGMQRLAVQRSRAVVEHCTVRQCPKRQCGQQETSMPVTRWRNVAVSSRAWGLAAGIDSAKRACASRSALTAGLSNP